MNDYTFLEWLNADPFLTTEEVRTLILSQPSTSLYRDYCSTSSKLDKEDISSKDKLGRYCI